VPLVSSAVSPCSRTGSAKWAADQRVARLPGESAKGVVDEGDAAFGVAQHDQIVLRFEQTAGALLGFLQFPVAVHQRFVVHGDLAQFRAHQPQPDAQRGERGAGDREQETDAERKRLRVIAGSLRLGAGDEAIDSAECAGEDGERAEGEDEPGMTAPEAAQMELCPEHPPHCRFPEMTCLVCSGSIRPSCCPTMRRCPLQSA